MSYVVLARKYRPKQFCDLVGQDTVTQTIQNAIRLGRVHHALIFTGTRGVGKTTAARILAKALNCEKNGPSIIACDECSNCKEIALGQNIDVFEIDGASSTSVDDVRQLRETVRYAPNKSKHKIYIIDEVHMLSNSAFNALLKTLEEPPSNVFFIFATTEPHKIPETIHSRCQRFDFKAISYVQIKRHLEEIAKKEGIIITDASLLLISKQAQGSLRDALSILDQVLAFALSEDKKITDKDVVFILGQTDHALIQAIFDGVVNHKVHAVLEVFDSIKNQGLDLKGLLSTLLNHVRDMLVLKATSDHALLGLSKDEFEYFESLSKKIDERELIRFFEILKSTLLDLPRVSFQDQLVEVALIKMCASVPSLSVASVINQVEEVMKQVTEKEAPSHKMSQSEITNTDVQKQDDRSFKHLLDLVKKEKPPYAAILAQSSKQTLNGNTLTLCFATGSFYIERAKDDAFLKCIQNAWKTLYGQSIVIHVQSIDHTIETSVDNVSNKEIQRQALGHPSVQKAVSLFDAKIEEVRPLKTS